MEILKVAWYLPEWDANPAAGGSVGSVSAQLGTISQGGINALFPQNVSIVGRNWRGAFTAAGTYEAVSDNPMTQDVSDGDGHGVLVATDNLFLDMVTGNFAGTTAVQCRILYRWKEVSLEEYIGIVQSQQ